MSYMCEWGTMLNGTTRGTLVTIGSGPNSTPPLKRGDGIPETGWKNGLMKIGRRKEKRNSDVE